MNETETRFNKQLKAIFLLTVAASTALILCTFVQVATYDQFAKTFEVKEVPAEEIPSEQLEKTQALACRYSAFSMLDESASLIRTLESYNTMDFCPNMEASIELLNDVRIGTSGFLPDKNPVTKDLDSLLENYQAILQLYTSEERNTAELQTAFDENSKIHARILLTLNANSSLYYVRRFYNMSSEEANQHLEEFWERFCFEGVECPKTISKKELKELWIEQFCSNADDEFVSSFNELMENDELTSKEYNLKWIMLLRKFYSTEGVGTDGNI